MITIDQFTRINNCVNGNPRYVLHFLALADTYNHAIALAYQCGGKAYKGKDYGGGIVFSTYSLPELIRHLEHIKTIGLPIKATVRSYKGGAEVFYYNDGGLVAWTSTEGHNSASLGYYKKTRPIKKEYAIFAINCYNKRYNTNLVYSSRLNHN